MKELNKVNLQFFADEKAEKEADKEVQKEKEETEVKTEVVEKEKTDLEQAYKNKFAEGARKAEQRILEQLGVASLDELKAKVDKPKTQEEELTTIKKEVKQLRALKQLNDLNVNRKYQDDVVAIIKGRGEEITEETIKAVIERHPNWLSTSKDNKEPIERIGSDGSKEEVELSEEEKAKNFLGW